MRPTPNEESLQAELQNAYRVEGASNELRARVAKLAAEIKPMPPKLKPRFRLSRRARLSWSLATAGMLVALMAWFYPHLLSSQAIARVEAAMARVKSVQMTFWEIDANGKRRNKQQMWFQGGKWRIEEDDGDTTIYRNGRLWNYKRKTRIVRVSRADGPFLYTPEGFTLADLLSDFKRQGEQTSVKLLDNTTYQGRAAKRVLLETRSDYETARITLIVDAQTDLPLHGDMKVRTRYGQESRKEMLLVYNQVLSAKLFEPKFPGARVVDAAREVKTKRRRMQTRLSRIVAKRKAGARTLIVRDFQANARGDVFLLYTAGKWAMDGFSDGENFLPGRDWKVLLSDDKGTKYHWMGKRGNVLPVGEAPPIGGQRLEADWWLPDTPQMPFTPRTYTLTFKLNPKNLHGPYRENKDTPDFPADYSLVRTFHLPLERAASRLLPSYAAELFIGLDEKELLKAEANERGQLPPSVQPSPQLWKMLSGNRDSVSSLEFSPDGAFVVGGAWDSGVRIWDVKSGQQLRVLRGASSDGSVNGFSPDGKTLVASYGIWTRARGKEVQSETQAIVWDWRAGKIKTAWRVGKSAGKAGGEFSPDGQTLRGAASIVTKTAPMRGRPGETYVQAMSVALQEREAATGRLLGRRILPHNGFIRGTASSLTRSSWLLATSQSREKAGRKIGGVVRLWNARNGKLLRTLPGTDALDTGKVALSPQGDSLAVVLTKVDAQGVLESDTVEVRLYNSQTGAWLRSLTPQGPDFIDALRFSPDGKLLAMSDAENTISVWDVRNGKRLYSLTGHGDGVRALAFSPDGKTLASGDLRGRIILWRL